MKEVECYWWNHNKGQKVVESKKTAWAGAHVRRARTDGLGDDVPVDYIALSVNVATFMARGKFEPG